MIDAPTEPAREPPPLAEVPTTLDQLRVFIAALDAGLAGPAEDAA
jgi:hypothetical protein